MNTENDAMRSDYAYKIFAQLGHIKQVTVSFHLDDFNDHFSFLP